MVVSPLTLAERFVPPSEPLTSGRARLVMLTRADAMAMVRLGIIPEDASTELLNGWIFLKDRSARDQDPTLIGKGHTKCVERLSDLRSKINSRSRHVESQQPLICTETHVPKPDFMVVRGTLDDYVDVPAASDVFCVVEVADSSYERDVTVKLVGYARAGIGQYVIIDLRNRTAEVYSEPNTTAGTYLPANVINADQMLALHAGDDEVCELRLVDVLP